MKEESFGPVFNPDGSPSDVTRQMLEGTGRSLNPPFDVLNFENNCASNCTETKHLLIERDYENNPYAWMEVIGPHDELVDAINIPIGAYIDIVDDESRFYLQPLKEGTIDDLAGQIVQEVAQAEEEEEELAKQESEGFQTTP